MSEPGIFEPLLTDREIGAILGDAAMAQAMVEVERALARVQGRLGVIDAAAARRIDEALAGLVPDLADLARGTATAGVPVPALVAQLRRAVGGEAGQLVHWGATSQDIVDTAWVLCLRRALSLLATRLDALIAALAELAERHRATPMAARTRFQQAVPTVLGLKVAGWLAPFLRHRARLAELEPRLLAVQLGGAAGNLAALGDAGVAVMTALAAELDLACPLMPWHSQRDAPIELASWLALLSGSLGKLGLDVLLLAQSELLELREAEGGGSSTMPQKANPVRSEALVTLARRNATAVAAMHEAALHAHERDGSAWQLEWVSLPGMLTSTAAALTHGLTLARTVVVEPARMRATLDASHGLLLAEPASFALAQHLPRADAQALVKAACQEALAQGRDLLDILAERSTAPVDWAALRAAAEQPPAAAELIGRVLGAVRPAS
ncbi:MAG: 3-carboxy-cis,cis-muconate cycloisomerase [Geminicoccaceae bacterium]